MGRAGASASSVSCIFFDCGSTLIDPDPSVAQQFVLVANRRGYSISLDEVEPYMPIIDRYYDMEYMKDGSFWASPSRSVELWYDIYRFMCHLTGLTDDVEGIAHDMFVEYLKPENWMVYPDVVPTLRSLKERGLVCAVVSNWDPSLTDLIRGLGLLPYFDEVFASAAVGYRKPDPMIFQVACEQLRVPVSSCIHVGDNVEADGQGAFHAGIVPCILDRRGRIPRSERERLGFPFVGSLNEVLALPQLAHE
ncbi:MAG: HAD family hydrolase [Eggerthellaceae bacterium]|jgi:putative hydrolase of the HAD superfamily